MRLTSIPRVFRNVQRAREIISVLSKYGLADWLSSTQLDFAKGILKDRQGEEVARFSREARLRMVLVELGSTFIKLGQILSTRPDLVGPSVVEELSKLQCNVPADPPEVVRAMIESELDKPLEDVYADFEMAPLASASIGQVHAAKLHTGEEVVVKVQHHGVEKLIADDLDILSTLAQLAERNPDFARYHPVSLVEEMKRTLRSELDFSRESTNLLRFTRALAKNRHVKIPVPFPEFSSRRVLTMERLDGVKLAETEKLIAQGADLEEVAKRGAEVYLQMIFENGFYHADPHPGNILVLPDHRIGLLDFGMVGRVGDKLREDMEDILLSLVNGDAEQLTRRIRRLGSAPQTLDDASLSADIADFVAYYGDQPMDQFDLSGALNEMINVIRRYDIQLPAQIGLLIKALVMLEGATRRLNPRFSLLELIAPYQRKILLRRLSPSRLQSKLAKILSGLDRVAESLPDRLMDWFELVQAGKFDVHLDHRGLEPSVNRLVLGMLSSALFLGSSVMLSTNTPPLFFPNTEVAWVGLKGVSMLGLGGCLLSLILAFRVLRAIGKSGHLDRQESRRRRRQRSR